MTCPGELEFARALGCGSDAELDAHLAACATCRAAWDGARAAIDLARDLPVDLPAPERREEVRTALLAAAARMGDRPARRSGWGLAIAAGVAAAAVGGAGYLAIARIAGPDHHARGAVRPLAGARYTVSASGRDEVVRLSDGAIDVEVEPLHPGERFRVVIGGAELEVRGTVFHVAARADRLVEVAVVHGRVDVHPAAGAPTTLTAGQSWRPPADPVAAAPAGTASVAAAPAGTASVAAAPASTASVAAAPASTASVATAPASADLVAAAPASTAEHVPAAPASQPPVSRPRRFAAAQAPRVAAPHRPEREPRIPLAALASRPQPPAAITPATAAGPPREPAAAVTPATAAAAPREPPAAITPATAAGPSREPATAVARMPADDEVAYDDAWAALRGGEFERAARGFTRVAQLAPDGSLVEDARFWRAVALARARRAAEAVAAFREFLDDHARSPRAGQASAMLGWLLIEARAFDEAARRFLAASCDPDPAVQRSARAGLDALARRAAAR